MNRVVIIETVRRFFSSIIVVAFVALMAILGLASARLQSPLWAPFVVLLAMGAGAGLIGPEFSSGTLQLILVKPINRSVYLVSRWMGAVLFLAIAASLAFACEAIGRAIWGGADQIGRAALTLLYAVSEGAMICGLLVFFGSFLRAYFNIALYWLIQIVLSIIEGLLRTAALAKDGFLGWLNDMVTRFPIISEALAWTTRNLYPDTPVGFDRDWLLMVWTNAAIAVVLACFVFRNREVPYGAD